MGANVSPALSDPNVKNPNASPGNTPGELSHDDLLRLCSNDKWQGLSGRLKRAAPDIYYNCRQGHSCVKDWLVASWGANPRSQQFTDLWHAACTIDLRVAEFSQNGPAALAQGLCSDDILEAHLRQLAAAKFFKLSGDSEGANRMLGYGNPDSSIAPGWLEEESRAHSTAMYKQGLRARANKPNQSSDANAKKDTKGKGRGKGKNS